MKKYSGNYLFNIFICSVNAQQEKGIIGYANWLYKWTEFKPNKLDFGRPIKFWLELFQ
jgi:hypothetical protein